MGYRVPKREFGSSSAHCGNLTTPSSNEESSHLMVSFNSVSGSYVVFAVISACFCPRPTDSRLAPTVMFTCGRQRGQTCQCLVRSQ